MKKATKKMTIIATGVVMIVSLLMGLISYAMPGLLSGIIDNEFIRSLKIRYVGVEGSFSRDRVYLQFDKTFYSPGETIWFSAYVLNAVDMGPSNESDILHVDLISPKGAVEKSLRLIAKNGRCAADLSLDEDAPGGMYKVKAWTQWQKNESDSLFFEKDIQVQDVILPNLKMKLDFSKKAYGSGDTVNATLSLFTNENLPLSLKSVKYQLNIAGNKSLEGIEKTDGTGNVLIVFKLPRNLKSTDAVLNIMIDFEGQTESISRSLPIVLNNIGLNFYPEGGDLVEGLQSKVAFRALNEFGKAADVSAEVLDGKNNVVAKFSSFYMGRGTFDFTPLSGESYRVKITRPVGITTEYKLPEALPMGYVMRINSQSSGHLALNIQSPSNTELSLVLSLRGKIYFSTAIQAVQGNNEINIPSGDLPMGVAQITLFDARGISRAERLVFVNKERQLNVSIETDKENYLPREKVKLTIKARDESGMPVPGSFSLSVVDDKLLSFADDKSGNLLSQIFLEQELKSKVEEPAFYFKRGEVRADEALDQLLLTSGWRRFSWDKIIKNEIPVPSFYGEKSILSGVLFDAGKNIPIEHAEVSVKNTPFKTFTTKEGKFEIRNLDLTEEKILVISAGGYVKSESVITDYAMGKSFYLQDINHHTRYNYMIPQAAEADFAMDQRMLKAVAPAFQENQEERLKEKAGKNNPEKKALLQQNKNAGVKAKINRAAGDKERKEDLALGKALMFHADEGLNFKEENQFRGNKNKAEIRTVYYRSRQFASPDYHDHQNPAVRNDFRSTLYWNPMIELDRSGKKVLEFYNSDAVSSFRITVEGIATGGMAGRNEKTYFTQMPFSMQMKFPEEILTGNHISIPLTLKNNTGMQVQGNIKVNVPKCLKLSGNVSGIQQIEARTAKIVYLDFVAIESADSALLEVSFNSNGMNDALRQKFNVVPNGFPVALSFSGNELSKSYCIEMKNAIKGSVSASLTAYPSVVSDLMKGVESILREPSGCFEQTSMSSYPNIMVMDYLKTTENKDQRLMASAGALLEKGYRKLISFETKEKGYEWFGGAPAHEALTAYGLMQFNDMKNVYGHVDQKMIDRTAEWLMKRKDGKGGFMRNERALDNFGGASKEITDAYVVYALAEAGYRDIVKEAEVAFNAAMQNKDPYQLALMANAMYKLGDIKSAKKAMDLLYKSQEADGSFMGKSHSITRSTNLSLRIETSSLAVMAMLKSSDVNQGALSKSTQYIVSSRSGHGAFGSTQGTILALKALTEFAKYSKQTSEAGSLVVFVDGIKAGETKFAAGEKGPILISGLEKYLTSAHHTIDVSYNGVKHALPYSVGVNYYTSLPQSQKECKVDLDVKLSSQNAKAGETVRLTVQLENTTKEGLPSTMVTIGIPAGMSAQAWQLKEIQEKKQVDYYEVRGNQLYLYFRQMLPSEIKNILLDLKAEIPGEFQAAPSSAYLYYTNEFKCWKALDKISIKKS